MSILIKGMKMPKDREVIAIFYGTAFRYKAGHVAIGEDTERVEVIELPPHGDLIDRDDVNSHVLGHVDLRDCPVIIPAERGAAG